MIALPFRRFDVVDADATVLLRGATADSLAPAGGARLEADVEAEVRRLLRELQTNGEATVTGLLDLDYAVRLVGTSDACAPGTLVEIERLTIRGAFERLVAKFSLTLVETELARLIVAGCSDQSIAWRMGLAPFEVKFGAKRLLERLGFASRQDLSKSLCTPKTTARPHFGTPRFAA